jgi:hypothetical protein
LNFYSSGGLVLFFYHLINNIFQVHGVDQQHNEEDLIQNLQHQPIDNLNATAIGISGGIGIQIDNSNKILCV